MKKIAATALLLSMALAACSNGENDSDTTNQQKPTNEQTTSTNPQTNTTKEEETATRPTEEKKQVEILAITADEVDVFLKTIPDSEKYSFSVEEGTDVFSAMLTSETDRKTAEIAKDSSVFKLINTDGTEQFLETYNPVQAVKAQRVLNESVKDRDQKLNVELSSIEGNNAFFEVFELVDKGKKTEHRNRLDNVVFDIQNKTFRSEEKKTDYSSLHVE